MPPWEQLLLKKKYAIQRERGDRNSLHPSLTTQYTVARTDDSASVCAHVSACTCKQDMYAYVHAHTHAQIFLKVCNFYILYSLHQKTVSKKHPPSNLLVSNLLYKVRTGTLHKPSSPPLYRICDVLSAKATVLTSSSCPSICNRT
jgi:hypothetical protein